MQSFIKTQETNGDDSYFAYDVQATQEALELLDLPISDENASQYMATFLQVSDNVNSDAAKSLQESMRRTVTGGRVATQGAFTDADEGFFASTKTSMEGIETLGPAISDEKSSSCMSQFLFN